MLDRLSGERNEMRFDGMGRMETKGNSQKRLLLRVALLISGFLTAGVLLLTPSQARAFTDGASKAEMADYTIGPGDVLSVAITDAPEFGGKFRVSDSGSLQIPGVTEPILAEGQTTLNLSRAIRQALIDAKQLRDPSVSVFVDEFHGRTITVLGSVTKPSVYSLQRHTTVLDALSLAGGALPNSGNTVTVVRGAASAEATGTPLGSVTIVDMARLTSGEVAGANIEVRNGDVINVSAAQVVYVVGAVIKPGGFTLTNPADGISVGQAVALAQGFAPLASTHHAVLVRQSTSEHGRREIEVDLGRILTGQETDVTLAPNDILYIPESGMKKTLKVLGEVAMATVNGIAIYGIGYRIGTQP